jgi:hypothetical protein
MFEQTIGLEVHNQVRAELAQNAEQDRLGRRILRERKAARVAARRLARRVSRLQRHVQPTTATGRPAFQ